MCTLGWRVAPHVLDVLGQQGRHVGGVEAAKADVQGARHVVLVLTVQCAQAANPAGASQVGVDPRLDEGAAPGVAGWTAPGASVGAAD